MSAGSGFWKGLIGRGSSGVEQLIRNQQVVGSIPILGSIRGGSSFLRLF